MCRYYIISADGFENGDDDDDGDDERGSIARTFPSLHLNVKVLPSAVPAARGNLLFCIRKLMIASELCF